ncbi:acyl dehydrogenase-like protein, putative [Bodo saltans]|uniref:Isobutyryl-CoA dehydrogenase, mitochondrial n=1 Tax=Bodo saltans TaxID=75058 RepID=A0A0S4J7W1_BODSA|nr:acyl dehydrogenase-like protein, putative [Bodo saltans]|eukprot:CUG61884.1 acyl dehydrogenase-like protein, putative [Bodo saltans]
MRRVLRVRCASTASTAAATRSFVPSVTFGLSEEQLSFVEAAKSFSESVLAPNAAKWDREKIFPVEALQEAAKLGFAGIYANSDNGGSGLSRLEASLIFEQLAMHDASTTAYLTIHNMCVWMIDSFGAEDTKKEILPALCSMEKFASYCLTEPSAGSDAASLRTVAKDCGDHYEVTGGKAFISGGGTSHVYVVMCRTGGEGAKGITCLVIDGDLAGVSFGKNESKMGWNSQRTSTVSFDRVKVPKHRVIGKVGEGFKIAMKGLDGGRVNIATCSLGAAHKAVELTARYAKERKQFGSALSEFQNTQFRLAEMSSRVHGSRLIVRQAAAAMDSKDPNATTYCAMAKLNATEDCFQVVDQALQLHGGYGYLQDFPLERHLRDLRVHRILEGTNEVMRMIVSRSVLKE